MSEAHIEKFYELASHDRTLIVEILKGTDGPQDFIKNAVREANERGFEFSYDEAFKWIQKQQEIKANGELSDAQLESVSGGKSKPTFDLSISIGDTFVDLSDAAEQVFDGVVAWATEGANIASGSNDPQVATTGRIVSNWFSSW